MAAGSTDDTRGHREQRRRPPPRGPGRSRAPAGRRLALRAATRTERVGADPPVGAQRRGRSSTRKPAMQPSTSSDSADPDRLLRHRQQRAAEPGVDGDDPEQAAPVELGRGGPDRGRAAAEHDRDQVAQRAEQHLGGEADGEERHERLDASGDDGPAGAERHLHGEPERAERRTRPARRPGTSREGRRVRRRWPTAGPGAPGRARPGRPARPTSRRGAGPPDSRAPAARGRHQHRQGRPGGRGRSPSIRVRSMVGHSVTRVPTTVRPTQPSRLRPRCARNRRS